MEQSFFKRNSQNVQSWLLKIFWIGWLSFWLVYTQIENMVTGLWWIGLTCKTKINSISLHLYIKHAWNHMYFPFLFFFFYFFFNFFGFGCKYFFLSIYLSAVIASDRKKKRNIFTLNVKKTRSINYSLKTDNKQRHKSKFLPVCLNCRIALRFAQVVYPIAQIFVPLFL